VKYPSAKAVKTYVDSKITLDVTIDSLSDVKYPSAKAVKTYVDSKITLDVLLDSLSDVKYPSAKAVKTYVDSKIATTVPPTSPSYTEAYDEITSASAGQTVFTLTNTPAILSKLKMFVNGIRISNSAYSISANVLTYDPSANGNYTLVAGARVQFDPLPDCPRWVQQKRRGGVLRK
jgi:hypothetical protein